MKLKHPSEHLTSNYEKVPNSNNYKILSLGHLEHEEILETLNRLEAYRDIDEAAGFTLDKVGKNVLELRDGRDDETFRQSIKIKIASSLSAGTIEDMITICEILFGDHFLSVQETWDQKEFNYEPAALLASITDDPEAQTLFFYYIRYLVMAVKAGGVRLYSKIISEITEASLYTGSAVTADHSSITIPAAMLQDMHFGHLIQVNAFTVSDSSRMTIRAKTVDNARIINHLYTGVGMSESGCMRIPTADIREANAYE